MIVSNTRLTDHVSPHEVRLTTLTGTLHIPSSDQMPTSGPLWSSLTVYRSSPPLQACGIGGGMDGEGGGEEGEGGGGEMYVCT